jgi:hypothetical protein
MRPWRISRRYVRAVKVPLWQGPVSLQLSPTPRPPSVKPGGDDPFSNIFQGVSNCYSMMQSTRAAAISRVFWSRRDGVRFKADGRRLVVRPPADSMCPNPQLKIHLASWAFLPKALHFEKR